MAAMQSCKTPSEDTNGEENRKQGISPYTDALAFAVSRRFESISQHTTKPQVFAKAIELPPA